MWGDKDKPDSLLLGSHFGMGGSHLMGGIHPHGGLYRNIRITAKPAQNTVLWKGDTPRRKRFEPFCSPMVPHVPIRQRLATRRCTSASVDVSDEPLGYSAGSIYGVPRRRRMSLLQTLRSQNRQLADSGLDMHRQRTDSESTTRETVSPPARVSPPTSPHKKAFSTIKTKLFGKKTTTKQQSEGGEPQKVYQTANTSDFSQSCDLINGAARCSRKSPSTTNDSGRGSQGHLEDKETIVMRVPGAAPATPLRRSEEDEELFEERPYRRIRTSSCPDLSLLRISNRAPLVSFESDEEGMSYIDRNSSPINAADCLLQSRLIRKSIELQEEQIRRKSSNTSHHRSAINAIHRLDEDDDLHPFSDDDSRMTSYSRRSNQTEDLADFDDNISTIVLDHYLALSRSSRINYDDEDNLSSQFTISLGADDNESNERCGTSSSTAQTDLSLVHVEEELREYLSELAEKHPTETEGMNFLAKHFFEYQSFINMPHKAIQMHKVPAQQAGTDPSMGWAPKNMNKAGKNQPAPGARANRIHRDPRPQGTKHGRAGKHEHREWGDKHGELKDEKVVAHKDAWTKFLSNEQTGQRTVFECDFEDRVLATEDETLPERLSQTPENLDFQMAYNASKTSCESDCELLTILTYAPTVQFVTATVKKAKALPYNSSPFARIMLFEGRRLIEQKQTTVNPSVGHSSSLETSSKPSSSSVSSSLSSSSAGDAAFSESFLFHLTNNKLDKCHLVIEMFDHSPTGRAVSVGHCVIGRLGSGTGHAHWLQMLKKHGLPVCMWHKITVN